MSELKTQIREDLKTAMRNAEAQRRDAIRLIIAAIQQREIDERIEADDQQIIGILDKLAKQRRESIEIYQKAERQDLADKENFELEVIQSYLPQPFSQKEIDQMIEDAIKSTNAQSMKDMGKVMGLLKAQLQGRADIGKVSAQIKAALQNPHASS